MAGDPDTRIIGTMTTTTAPPAARPYTLIIRATERCRVGCDHCCINAVPRGGDIPLSLVELAIEHAKLSGVGLIHFSGGEPLLHDDLVQFVKEAADSGMYVEVTTSTFTELGEQPANQLRPLKRAGLQRVMLSYDASHARRVSIDHFAEFMREAQAEDLEVCAVVVEWEGSAWPLERVRTECIARGVNGGKVDWCRTGLSLIGRAERRYAGQAGPTGKGARCPYMLTAPTLTPDGTVFLCPNAESRSALFRLGNVKEQSLPEILTAMESSRFYRGLSVLGPHGAAAAIGMSELEVPGDMCACCQSVLRRAENREAFDRISSASPADGNPVPLDIEALLPGHRRFVLGEDRPQAGCMCG